MSVSRHLMRKMRKRKRGRRKKDLANTQTAVKKGKKNSTAISAGWSLSYNALPLSAELRWAPTCAALVQTPLTTKGAR